jgi:hypothetical protein
MRHDEMVGASARRVPVRWRVALLGALALGLLGACGQSSTSTGNVGPDATATATATYAPTATGTPTPTATMTPAHMLLRVTPDPGRCGTSCTPFICTPPGGASCSEPLACTTAMSFAFFEVDNSGQSLLTWSWTITNAATGSAKLTLTPNGGTVAGGAASAVTLNADMYLDQNGPKSFTINFSGGGASIAVQAQC